MYYITNFIMDVGIKMEIIVPSVTGFNLIILILYINVNDT